MSLAQNLALIRQQIADACRRAGRSEAEVALMAVSKMQPAEAVTEAYAAGLRLFGENRVQEWQLKLPSLQHLFTAGQAPSKPDAAHMHLIGPLQSNKANRAAELFDAIDSVASLRIATRLNAAARVQDRHPAERRRARAQPEA